MSEKFHQLMEKINKDLIFLANQVEHSIRQSIKALEKQDTDLALKVIEGDKEVDIMEVEIEDQFLSLLALQQPVAVDLRFIVAGLKMNNDLERIGDHAVNISKTVVQLAKKPMPPTVHLIPKMSKVACNMLHEVVNAFIHQDADLARDVCGMDNEVDDFYLQVVTGTIDFLKKDSAMLEQGFGVTRIARFLERVGDLATNIAEDVVFMKEAKIIRHHFDV